MRIKLLFLFLFPLFVFAQKTLRDSIYIKTNMFEIVYSEKLQQPKFIRYTVQCPNGTASRKGMDFYTCDSILTSDNLDYVNNPYDKGHLAPAASFSCDRETLYKTFTYLNCSLQQENLNRTTWRLLEERERELAKKHKVVIVEIRCVFSPKSVVLPLAPFNTLEPVVAAQKSVPAIALANAAPLFAFRIDVPEGGAK